MAARAILFDLDGTMCDSRPWYVKVLVEQHGADRRVVERRLAEGVPPVRLAQDLGLGRDALLRSCQAWIDRLALYPDVARVLRDLGRHGCRMAVVSSLAGKFVDLVLDGHALRKHFEAVVPFSRTIPRKPHPASLLHALGMMRLGPAADVWYVGDAEEDGQAAAAAGLSFAWAAYGYSHERPQATQVSLQSFAEVLAL